MRQTINRAGINVRKSRHRYVAVSRYYPRPLRSRARPWWVPNTPPTSHVRIRSDAVSIRPFDVVSASLRSGRTDFSRRFHSSSGSTYSVGCLGLLEGGSGGPGTSTIVRSYRWCRLASSPAGGLATVRFESSSVPFVAPRINGSSS